jgi:hypothetical protein
VNSLTCASEVASGFMGEDQERGSNNLDRKTAPSSSKQVPDPSELRSSTPESMTALRYQQGFQKGPLDLSCLPHETGGPSWKMSGAGTTLDCDTDVSS